MASLVIYAMQLPAFSLTRWVKIGRSARLFFRSLACGLEGVFDLCSSDPAISMYHVNGFLRARFHERRYLAVAMFCSYPCESFSIDIMSDDRFLRRSAQLREELEVEFMFLCDLPMSVWARAASHIEPGFEGAELRHLALEASYRSLRYLYKEAFASLEVFALSLCQGDIQGDLERLRHHNADTMDEATQKARYPLDAGWPLQPIVSGIALWRDAPCSTDLVEQAHGSGAWVMGFHSRYCEQTLRCRSVIHQCRSLISPSPHEKMVSKLKAQLEKAEARRPKLAAFQAFVKANSKSISEQCSSSMPAFQRQQHVLKRCRTLFAALPRREAQLREQRARVDKALDVADREAECTRIRSLIELEQARHDHTIAEEWLPNHIGACRLGDSELQAMLETFNGTRSSNMRSLQEAGLTSPVLPYEAEQSVLLQAAERHRKSSQACPSWARHFVVSRDLFRGAALSQPRSRCPLSSCTCGGSTASSVTWAVCSLRPSPCAGSASTCSLGVAPTSRRSGAMRAQICSSWGTCGFAATMSSRLALRSLSSGSSRTTRLWSRTTPLRESLAHRPSRRLGVSRARVANGGLCSRPVSLVMLVIYPAACPPPPHTPPPPPSG